MISMFKTGGNPDAASTAKIPYYLIGIFSLLTVSIGIAGYIYHDRQKAHIIREKQDELSAIADLKVSQLDDWRNERLKDVMIIADTPAIINTIGRFMENENAYGLRADVSRLLKDLAKYYDYERTILFDPDGRLRLWAGKKPEDAEGHARVYMADALRKGKPDFIDLHKSGTDSDIHFGLSVPLFSNMTKDRHLIGILILRIDPFKFLYPLIQSWPTPSPTAETLLVRREGDEVVFLNDLRHKKNTALSLRFPLTQRQLPAAMAALGKKGVVGGIDYRGIPVIAVTRTIPHSPWSIVSKIDKEEIYAPVRKRAWFIAIIVFTAVVGAGLSVGLWWRQQAVMYYRRQYETEIQFNEERGQKEKLLLESEARLKRSQEIAHLGSWELDVANNVITWSDEVYRIFGLKPREFGATYEAFLEHVHPDDRAAVDAAYSASLREGRDTYEIEHRVVRKTTGEIRYVHEKCAHVRDEAGRIIQSAGMVHDITERKRAEQALRFLKLRYEAILSAVPDIIMEVDNNKVYTWANKAGHEFFGDDVIGKEAALYFEGEQKTYNTVQPLFNGSEDTIYVESWQRCKDGGKRLLAWWCRVLKDPEGNVTGALSTARDITGQKQAEEELKKYTNELKRSNEELKQFAYIASHDLQEPLRMIASYLQLIERRYKGRLDKDADEFMAFAVEGATRLQEMITGLLAYSRVETRGKAFEEVNSAEVLGKVISNLKIAIAESGTLVTTDRLPVIRADASQIIQVFQNLISNAIKFRGSGPPRVHVSAELKEAEWVFSVSDNGIGVSPEYREKIFNIFQRLQGREYPGVGIGLSICRRIIERHGGRIWFESEAGKGTNFYFTIPIREDGKS